jgi:hypothetical protein
MIKDIDNLNIDTLANYADIRAQEVDKELENLIKDDPELRDLITEDFKESKTKKREIDEDDCIIL